MHTEIRRKSYIGLVGNTPMVDLSQFTPSENINLFAKCEFMNPGFSMKDRMASHILDRAEQTEGLARGDTIVCASSGNTGCSIAMQGNIRGYRVIISTYEKCSDEKQNHIRGLNAELIVIPEGKDYMEYATALAIEKGYFDVDQYNNRNNTEAYYNTLGPEIWKDTQGRISHFVMTGSTYGCISGTAKFLKEQNEDIQVILVDPQGSNIYNYFYNVYQTGRKDDTSDPIGKPSLLEGVGKEEPKDDTFDPIGKPSLLEGVGKEKPTGCILPEFIDEVIKVSDQEAIGMCHRLAGETSVLVGGSSGLNVAGALRVAQMAEPDSVIVTLLCDSGIKYLSKIYNHSYLAEQGIHLNHG